MIRESGREITLADLAEGERKYVENLLAALAGGDFAPFERKTQEPLPSDPPWPGREEFLRRERERDLEMFGHARRAGGIRRMFLEVHEQFGSRFLTVVLWNRDARGLDIGMRCNLSDPSLLRRGWRAPYLSWMLTDRPIEAEDEARVEAIVAALIAGDWNAFDRLTPRRDLTRDDGKGEYFDLFAKKVGGIRAIRNRVGPRDSRDIRVVLSSREAGGPDLILILRVERRGPRDVFWVRRFVEEGFDIWPLERTLDDRWEKREGERRAREAADQRARARAATRAVRLPLSASDEDILAVLTRWNDTIAAGDFDAALDMVTSRDGWTHGEQLRDFIADLDLDPGDSREKPHRITPFATAGDLRPPDAPRHSLEGITFPQYSVHRRSNPIEICFTPPLDGYWAPFVVLFHLVEVDGMWVIEADVSGMASLHAAADGRSPPRNARPYP